MADNQPQHGRPEMLSLFTKLYNDEAGFTYSNYYDPSLDPNVPKLTNGKPDTTSSKYVGPAGFYPPLSGDVYEVNRLYDILEGTAKVNDEVHSALKAALVAAGKTVPSGTPTKAK